MNFASATLRPRSLRAHDVLFNFKHASPFHSLAQDHQLMCPLFSSLRTLCANRSAHFACNSCSFNALRTLAKTMEGCTCLCSVFCPPSCAFFATLACFAILCTRQLFSCLPIRTFSSL